MQYTTDPSTQGICPDGWHIPSDDEWKTLETFLGMSSNDVDEQLEWRGTTQGKNLKEEGTNHWNSYNNADNASNFTALGGGARSFNDYFDNIKVYAYFWTSTISSTSNSNAYVRILKNDYSTIYRGRSDIQWKTGYSFTQNIKK